MPQTPISASVVYNSTTPTTIYTVPAGATAVVKGILAASEIGGFNTVTVNKVSGGVNYPVVLDQTTGYIASSGTYYNNPGISTVNLLRSPVTLAAGDSITISTSSTSAYRVENATTATNYKIANFNYLNGYYIAVGQDNSTAAGLVLTSTDGITYTKRTFTATVLLTNVVFGNGYYVVCNSTGGTIHYSTDLNTWTSANLPSTYACYGLVYGGTTFVVGGVNGEHARASTTPVTWTAGTVQTANTIRDIDYISTNFLFLNTGVSYYTADFTTYTSPYLATLNTAPTPRSVAAGSTGYYVTNTLTPASNPNTILRTSANALSWSAVNTVANSLNSAYMQIGSVGGHFIFMTYYGTASATPYLYSSNGTTWNTATYSGTAGSNGGYRYFQYDGYRNTANATYNNKGFALIQDATTGNYWFNMFTTAATGLIGSQNSTFQASDIGVAGGFVVNPSGSMPTCGNPFDGSFRTVTYYSSSGSVGGAGYYGNGPSNGSNSYQVSGWSTSLGAGYGACIGCLPNSPIYYMGSTGGWVFPAANYNSGASSAVFGSPSYVTNPAGFTFPGSPVAGMARGGEASTSPFVIVWANGYFATTTNQGLSWTYGNVGFGSISTQMDMFGSGPIVFGNGNFIVTNSSGQVAISSDGINWSAMISNVESGYSLNSQNVFITSVGIFTSPSASVTSFSYKSSPTGVTGNGTVRRMAYANSTYYLFNTSNQLLTSSDLITWTAKSFVQPTLNNSSFFSSNYGAIAYSGSGTTIAVCGATSSGQSSATVSKTFTPSTSIYVGSATAAIVQIT